MIGWPGLLIIELMTMGPFFAAIQSTVEPDMQARVFSLLSSVWRRVEHWGTEMQFVEPQQQMKAYELE